MEKSKKTHDEHAPSWLDEDNDEKHRETLPLFGEGRVDFAGPPPQPEEDKKQQQQPEGADSVVETTTTASSNIIRMPGKSKKIENNKNYGAIASNKNEEKMMEEGTEVLLNRDEAKYVKAKLVDTQSLKPHVPSYNPCLWLFHLLEGVTTVVCCCLLVTQIFPFFVMKLRDIGILATLLKIYIALFCLLFVLTETGAPVPLLRQSTLLQPYASRGFLYSFLGLICVEEAYSERVKDMMSHGSHDEFHISWAPLFMQVTAWLVLSSGVIYMLLGMCCLKRLRDRLKQNEIDAWRQYRENLREWQQRFG